MNVIYYGEALEYSGYGEAARINIALLHKLGHTVKVIPKGSKHNEEMNWKWELAESLVGTEMMKPDLVWAHIYPPSELANIPALPEGCKVLAYIAWETDMLPTNWVNDLNKYADTVVTTCEEMKGVFIRSGVVKPVFVLGPTIFEEDLANYKTGRPNVHEIPEWLKPTYIRDRFYFYSIFQWIERKDPVKLISAFVQEFDNMDNVGMIIKAYRRDYSEKETEALLNSVRLLHLELGVVFPPEVRLIPFKLSDLDIHRLHQVGHCYVSPHRGEGTGIPIMDAILHERPVITTPYGGPSDYTVHEFTRHLKYKMIPIHQPIWLQPSYFNSNMMWADVDIMDLRKAMRDVYNAHLEEDDLCKQARNLLIRTCSIEENSNRVDHILGVIEQ